MFQLYNTAGPRKYLAAEERSAFLKAAEQADRQARTLCTILAYTGSRISEALQLTADRVDLSGKVIVFENLKKRRKGSYRAVPVPATVLDALDLVHGLREAQRARDGGKNIQLWPWSRVTAWRRVSKVMAIAKIDRPQASPKGLWHGFGVTAVQAGIPSTWSRNGWGTPNYRRPRSMRTPQVSRNRQSPNGCGLDLTACGETRTHHSALSIGSRIFELVRTGRCNNCSVIPTQSSHKASCVFFIHHPLLILR